jgi:hypothetical protein
VVAHISQSQPSAIACLCHELTTTQTRYPGTNLKIEYNIKVNRPGFDACIKPA